MIANALDFIKLYTDLLKESLKGCWWKSDKITKGLDGFLPDGYDFYKYDQWESLGTVWSGGRYLDSALSKMLRWALIIPWNLLLLASTRLIISFYGVLMIQTIGDQKIPHI